MLNKVRRKTTNTVAKNVGYKEAKMFGTDNG